MQRPEVEKPDISEKGGRGPDGQPQRSDHRLYMQLQAYGGCPEPQAVIDALIKARLDSVVYLDLNDPQGIAVLLMNDTPDFFVNKVRAVLGKEPFTTLQHKPQYTMFGRSYALGYEPDLEEVLIRRPRFRALNPDWPWVVWYPIKRSGRFMQLPHEQQMEILKEHGGIGIAYGAADYAHDIRLACHGLDINDSDFMLGLVGKELFPLSAIVQRMRSTVQTSQYLDRLGPFFIGKALWQSPQEVE